MRSVVSVSLLVASIALAHPAVALGGGRFDSSPQRRNRGKVHGREHLHGQLHAVGIAGRLHELSVAVPVRAAGPDGRGGADLAHRYQSRGRFGRRVGHGNGSVKLMDKKSDAS